MPRGNLNPNLPHSGLVGLNWRRRGSSGYWVVSKAVPLALRSRLRTPKGKPRFRIELSTGDEVGAFYWTDLTPDIVNSGREEQGSISL